jgi:hypothetical protein
MNSRIKKRWLAVGLIWGAVLLTTFWNVHMADQVRFQRQELETLQMDMRFLQANQAGVEEVKRERSRLVHTVPSFSLGFVVVENDLKRLSWDFDLQQLRIKADKNAAGLTTVPISIFAGGSVPAIVGWIAAVEEAYPHLVIEKMEIVYESGKRICQLQATFNYHYVLGEAERAS